MQKFSIISLFVFLICSSPISFAKDSGFFVEPGLFYELGDSTVTYPAPFSDSDEESNGFGIFGRFGFHIQESFFAGIDARFKRLDFNSSNNYEADADAYNVAPVIGVQMPDIGLRLWAAYVVFGEVDPESNNGTDLKFEDGLGLRVGGGFRLWSLSLNLEYENLEYGRTVIEQAGVFGGLGSTDMVNYENKAYVLSVSFPLEL